MTNKTPQEELLQKMEGLAKRFERGGDLAPVQNREEWDKLVESRPAEEQQLLKELASFADLWRYLQERNESLGPEIVNRIKQLQIIPISQRISELKEVNQILLQRIGDAHQNPELRQ